MPQLDRVIIFSQIFWLFIIFTIFYAILTHFFLPIFLKSLKSRQQIIECNTKETLQITETLYQNQTLLKKIIVKNLNLTIGLFVQHFNQLLDKENKTQTIFVDKKLSQTVENIIKLYDLQSLNSVLLYPRVLNLRS
uniref:ATP synthase F0 subunit 8 n=1 Tax=Melanthalia intermedia TaxID=172989 RepID=A0A345UBQ1_9FLOR|nr:ATP synthase F0 subunit 8 [Melanthalia intermedia]AXI97887.1 ATP synthase F0 subunit 8 [Melanthalia intermedia]